MYIIMISLSQNSSIYFGTIFLFILTLFLRECIENIQIHFYIRCNKITIDKTMSIRIVVRMIHSHQLCMAIVPVIVSLQYSETLLKVIIKFRIRSLLFSEDGSCSKI